MLKPTFSNDSTAVHPAIGIQALGETELHQEKQQQVFNHILRIERNFHLLRGQLGTLLVCLAVHVSVRLRLFLVQTLR